MRLRRVRRSESGGDLTPMIDMVFQLVAFFMFVINFAEAEQDQRVKLPSSPLAKPPDGPIANPVYLHLTAEGTVVAGGTEMQMDRVRGFLIRETEIMRYESKTPDQATVIIRADGLSRTGDVRRLVQICQEAKFENFALRAKEKVPS